MSSNIQIPEQNMAKAIAPEDILIGDFLAFLGLIEEIEPYVFSCDLIPRTICAPKYVSMPRYVEPMKVRAVCLPYVFVKLVGGQLLTLDVRQVQLAKLPKDYAKYVWKAHRLKAKKERKEKSSE